MSSASTPPTSSPSTSSPSASSPSANGPAVGKVSSYAFWGHDGRVLADFYAAALHLDLAFDDIAAAEARLLGLGATKPEHQPGGEQWTVLLDPSGQPFCVSRPWA